MKSHTFTTHASQEITWLTEDELLNRLIQLKSMRKILETEIELVDLTYHEKLKNR